MSPTKQVDGESSSLSARKQTGLGQVFANLSRWRAIPGYQSERRIDALMSPFIGPFLSQYFERRGHGKDRVELVTSEFPLPARLYAADGQSTSSPGNAAADFLALRRGDRPAWILVELKTDLGSRSKEQARRYQKLADYTMEQVLCYLQPRVSVPRKPKPGPAQAIAPDWKPHYTFGLGRLASFLDTVDDELAAHLSKFLRGAARSEKARRVKDRRHER